MLNKQPTIDSFVASGYETDDAPAAPRRSSRVVTPARRAPGMITPSSDSRRGLGGLGDVFTSRDVRDAHVHRRRERSASLPGDEVFREPALARGQSNTSHSRVSSHSFIVGLVSYLMLMIFHPFFFFLLRILVPLTKRVRI
jgi:hypothetical protein